MKHLVRIALMPLVLAAAPLSARDDEPVVPATPSAEDAPVALLVDMNSGQVLHARGANRRFMPASVTKTMTAYVAFELMDSGKLSPKQIFTVDKATYRDWANKGSNMALAEGERVSLDELLTGILTSSANDACIVLAKGAAGSTEKWVALMNAKAAELGMTDSHFGTPNGWMDEGRTFTSARDLVKLARALITRHPEAFHRYVGLPRHVHNEVVRVNHDPLLGKITGADGIKTGYTKQAGYTYLGTAERNGRRLVMVIAGSPKPKQRAKATRAFMEWGFSHFATRRLFPAKAIIGSARLQGGAALSVPLVAHGPVTVSYASRTKPPISLTIRYKGPLKAPIEAGAEVAEMEVVIEGQPKFHVPLVAGEAVARANWWQRLRNGLVGLFA